MKLKSSLSTTALITALSFLSVFGENIHPVQAFEDDSFQGESSQGPDPLLEEELADEESPSSLAGDSTEGGNAAFPLIGINPPQKKSGPLNPASNVLPTQAPSSLSAQTRSTGPNFVQKAMTSNVGSKGAHAFSRGVEASRTKAKPVAKTREFSLKEQAIAALMGLPGVRNRMLTNDQVRVAENLLGSGKTLPNNFFQGFGALTTGANLINANVVTGPQVIAMANALAGRLTNRELPAAKSYLAANPALTILPTAAIILLMTGPHPFAYPNPVQINAMDTALTQGLIPEGAIAALTFIRANAGVAVPVNAINALTSPGPLRIADPALVQITSMEAALPHLLNQDSILAARDFLSARGNINPEAIAAINALTTSQPFAPTPLQVGLMVEAQDVAGVRPVMPPLENTPEAHAAATAYIRSLPAGGVPAAVPTEAINFLTGGANPMRNVTPAQITETVTAIANHLDTANANASTLVKEFLSSPGGGGAIPVQAINIVINGGGAPIANPTLDHVLKIQQALDNHLDHANAAAVEGARNFLVAYPTEPIPAGTIHVLTAAGPGAIEHPTAIQIKAMDTALAGGALNPDAIQAARNYLDTHPGQAVPVEAYNALVAAGPHQVLNPTEDQLTAISEAFNTYPGEMRNPALRDLAIDFIGAHPASDLVPPLKAISILVDTSVPGAEANPSVAQMTDMHNVVMTGQFNPTELLAARQYILANPGVPFPIVGNPEALKAARLFVTQDPGQSIPVEAIMALTTGEYRLDPGINSIRIMAAAIADGTAGTPQAIDAIKILLPARNQVSFHGFGVGSDINPASIAAVEAAVRGLNQAEGDAMADAIGDGVISVLSPQQVENARSFVENGQPIPQELPQAAKDAFPAGVGVVAPGQALWTHAANVANDPTDLNKLHEEIATAVTAGAAGPGFGGYAAAGAGHALRFFGFGGGMIAHGIGAAITPQEAERNARTAHNAEALRIADTLSHAALGIVVPTAYNHANPGSSVAGINNAIADDLYAADGTRFAHIEAHSRLLRKLADEENRICVAGAVPCDRNQADRLEEAARHFEEIIIHVRTREAARPAAVH